MAGSGFEALLVALGAIPGAWLRLKWVNHLQPMVPHKHWGTFAVNVLACFSLGLVVALVERCEAATGVALLIGVGFLGSLSTFTRKYDPSPKYSAKFSKIFRNFEI